MPIPPASVQRAARKGLELRRKFGRGGTSVGVARARDLSGGRNVSERTLKRMRSYFARHEVDSRAKGWKDEREPSAGWIAWLLWGGDAGRYWAEKELAKGTRRRNMGIPSKADIIRDMATGDTELGDEAATIAYQAMKWANGSEPGRALEDFYESIPYGERRGEYLEDVRGSRVGEALKIMNRALECHGVEYIEATDGGGGFEYLNTGDAYTATIGYDHGEGEWLLTTYGDVVEEDPERFGGGEEYENPGELDEGAVRELVLYVQNDGQLHHQQEVPIIKNLVNKQAAGKYRSDLAAKAFGYLVESGAKKYAKEFGGTWHQMFPPDVRRAAAEELRDYFEAEAALGNYDDLLFKKYQGRRANAGGKVSIPKATALKMMNWHSSMGDPIYAAGSTAFAGHPVPVEVAQDALDGFKRLAADPGFSATDKRELKSIINVLSRRL